MTNKDLLKEENKEIMQKLSAAMAANDDVAMVAAMTDFATGIENRIMEEYSGLQQSADRTILASRGVRQLTKEETDFYQSWIDANQSANPKQAIVDLGKAMPQTIIDTVIDDMKESHELLSNIDFINCQGAIKMITNAENIDLATWDALTTAIATELSGKIDVMDMTLAKLSAFLPVSKDMLKLGPVWLDNYSRIILSEASAAGLEKAIIKGTGKNQPIGMIKDLKGAVTDGVYSDKTKTQLKSLDPVEYCGLIAPLAKKPFGDYRTVSEVLLIVNPVDYIAKIFPASTVMDAQGNYKNNVFPFPTKLISSAALDQNEAVIGLPKQYFMGIGAGESGKIEYSDEYQFLEDNRVYLTKMYGMGKPKDNNSYLYVDITKLKPLSLKVEVTNSAENPVNTKGDKTSA